MPVNQNSSDAALKFKTGDRVIYTNNQAVVFEGYRVSGFYEETGDLYKYGYRYYLDFKDSPWMPVEEKNLTLAP